MTKAIFIFLLVQTQVFAANDKTLPVHFDSKPKAVQTTANFAKDLLLEIDGKIYPQEDFPSECKQLTKGVKCASDSYGKYHVEAKKEDDLVYSKAVFSVPEGPQVIEQSWEKDGMVKKAIIENKALGKISELEVKDGRVFYKVTDTEGKVKTSEEKADKNLVVPSTVMSFIRPHHSHLLSGKELELKVAVLDRRESFTFIMKKIRDEKASNGDDVMVLEMKPASFIVRALVDPMYFYVRPKTGEMFAFEGKSALRKKVDGKYKEMNVRAAYDYKINAFNTENAKKTAAAPSSCGVNEMLNPTAMKCEVKTE